MAGRRDGAGQGVVQSGESRSSCAAAPRLQSSSKKAEQQQAGCRSTVKAHLGIGELAPAGAALLGGAAVHALADAAPRGACSGRGMHRQGSAERVRLGGAQASRQAGQAGQKAGRRRQAQASLRAGRQKGQSRRSRHFPHRKRKPRCLSKQQRQLTRTTHDMLSLPSPPSPPPHSPYSPYSSLSCSSSSSSQPSRLMEGSRWRRQRPMHCWSAGGQRGQGARETAWHGT